MALPQVAKISPRSAAAVPEPAAPASTPSLAGFGRFAVQHGLWLIVLTLLLALPSLRSALGRVSGIFNPYR
jgi:hypothetical protein